MVENKRLVITEYKPCDQKGSCMWIHFRKKARSESSLKGEAFSLWKMFE